MDLSLCSNVYFTLGQNLHLFFLLLITSCKSESFFLCISEWKKDSTISGKQNRKPFGILICKSLNFSTQSIKIKSMGEWKMTRFRHCKTKSEKRHLCLLGYTFQTQETGCVILSIDFLAPCTIHLYLPTLY